MRSAPGRAVRPLIPVLAWVVLVGAPLPSRAEPAPSCRLEGRVLERGSLVTVVGATLATRERSATTGTDGTFAFDVPCGSVELAIRAGDYEPYTLTEQLPPGTRRLVEYRLTPVFRARYRSTVRGSRMPHEGERFTLRDEELHNAPGTAGDPMRVIGTLPGVIAPIPVLPIYVIRGGSPGMNGFFLDGMRIPQLFHLVFVDGVVHPRLLDRIDFYPGSYDASFGRYGSGIVDAATRPGRTDAPAHGDVELRLFDLSALAEARLPDGATVVASGRYGYPGPLIHLVAPQVDLGYWDYQLRIDWRGLTLEAIGSSDTLSTQPATSNGGGPAAAPQFLIEFHRLQLREQARLGAVDLEAAVVGGLDRMAILSGQGVQKLSLAARASLQDRVASWLALQAGVDGELSRFRAEQFETDQTRAAPDALGDLTGDRDGATVGGYAQAQLKLDEVAGGPASLTLGVRADLYHAGAVTLLGIDPRLTFRYRPIRHIEIFGGFGQYTQPPSFPVPLPGIDTFALQLGLQRNLQGSAGVRTFLPEDISVSATGYYGRFDNINDTVVDLVAAACTSAPPESLKGVSSFLTRQLTGAGYGMELLVRRSRGLVSGWLAYTLSRSERHYSCGLAPSDFDQTHVLNAVVQVRLPWRMMAGAHLSFSTGRPFTQLRFDLASLSYSGTRNNARIPDYLQLDLRIDREWIYDRWALSVFVDVLNVTYSESIYGITYPTDPLLMVTRYDQPQFQGFRWILPSIGVRGRF